MSTSGSPIEPPIESNERDLLRVGSQWIEISHGHRVLFEGDGFTKRDLIEYYYFAAGFLRRYLYDRPLMMQRAGWRDGSIEKTFVQQRPSPNFPKWIQRVTVEMQGGTIEHVVCNDAATLVFLVNQGMITPHVWTSRIDRPHCPDQIIFDLDPGTSGFEAARDVAFLLREVLAARKLVPFVMTTGGRGLHVRVPIRREHDFDVVRAYAKEVADEIASAHTAEVTTETRKAKRGGRLYIDVLRNAYAQNSVVPYAVRARRHAPVAAPLSWVELEKETIEADSFSLLNIRQRLSKNTDPWQNFRRHARTLRL